MHTLVKETETTHWNEEDIISEQRRLACGGRVENSNDLNKLDGGVANGEDEKVLLVVVVSWEVERGDNSVSVYYVGDGQVGHCLIVEIEFSADVLILLYCNCMVHLNELSEAQSSRSLAVQSP